jgi:hypothetical protein
VISRHRAGVAVSNCYFRQLRPEKPNVLAKEPKPPRVTPPELASAEVVDDERVDELSPPKKLERDDHPYPPPPDDPRGVHLALVCGTAGAAIPGGFGWQFSGISA